MSTPGPSQLLMLSNSATHGFKRSLATACGDLSANFLQMLAAGLGLAAILAASADAIILVKWLGAAYLLWLGVKMIRNSSSKDVQNQNSPQRTTKKTLWLQGFLTSAANPKAIVFFSALFPQFIDPSLDFPLQFLILSGTYIAIDGILLATYGMSAGWIAKKFAGNAKKWTQRLGGTFMILAAILLGFKTIEK